MQHRVKPYAITLPLYREAGSGRVLVSVEVPQESSRGSLAMHRSLEQNSEGVPKSIQSSQFGSGPRARGKFRMGAPPTCEVSGCADRIIDAARRARGRVDEIDGEITVIHASPSDKRWDGPWGKSAMHSMAIRDATHPNGIDPPRPLADPKYV